jgi:hypothetical protein
MLNGEAVKIGDDVASPGRWAARLALILRELGNALVTEFPREARDALQAREVFPAVSGDPDVTHLVEENAVKLIDRNPIPDHDEPASDVTEAPASH